MAGEKRKKGRKRKHDKPAAAAAKNVKIADAAFWEFMAGAAEDEEKSAKPKASRKKGKSEDDDKSVTSTASRSSARLKSLKKAAEEETNVLTYGPKRAVLDGVPEDNRPGK